MKYYKEDLAYIHDVGFSDYCLKSAPGILEILQKNHINRGLVVDLGCGSGLWAQELVKSGYHVIGFDISHAFIDIARKKVPKAEFRLGSLFDAEIPACNAVTSIGECLNYLFDLENDNQRLIKLFRRIYQALTPGGVFVFDIATPEQVIPESTTKSFTEGKDWIVLVEKEEKQQILTRRIITFRSCGEYYRKDEETHYQQLYKATDIAQTLEQIGFQVQILKSYGEFNLPLNHAAFIALKLT
ncbi:class I SAM-dependent methyltransferase [Plectonema cf. radiosum LEGE 06105]|uniref:Class I SAM-dependent methyltransferase n=1 Tax=Plectonema cf. radiosum LEGE 06105 TaxID=945769 RepID=A0A8J7FH68_9CYAN|nr:class I SAM-dependent methyltransferase [Plectonema radiosum]MBE9216233.1 class I SAM-dependent methyltransferase [Plectonema cf. radiosum LEGE 06105]